MKVEKAIYQWQYNEDYVLETQFHWFTPNWVQNTENIIRISGRKYIELIYRWGEQAPNVGTRLIKMFPEIQIDEHVSKLVHTT